MLMVNLKWNMKLTKRIQLIQPRHIYAPTSKINQLGHIYLPSSLITIGSILLNENIEIELIDENINTEYEIYNVVGINLLGAPYIPVVRDFEKRLEKKYSSNYTLFIGGQIVNGLSESDFKNLFGKRTFNGNNLEVLFDFFNQKAPLKRENELSHVSVFNIIDDVDLKLYLEKEFSLYLSQGCKYSCTFCSADRTKVINGKKVFRNEVYRNIDAVIEDLKYLIKKAKQFRLNKLSIYLSNLDLFQTPRSLTIFVDEVDELLQREQFDIDFRGLATVASFLKLYKTNITLLEDLKRIGLVRVGYGIDGATAEVYKKTKKPQNSEMCLDAIRLTAELGITPETLMVFGHNNKEDEKSLKKAYEFCKDMFLEYGSLPRPHISKDIVPGNDGWSDFNNSDIIKEFYNDILLFQNLDFTALPSKFTHPDEDFRKLVSEYFIKICSLPSSLTQYVKPYDRAHTDYEKEKIKKFNEYKYDI